MESQEKEGLNKDQMQGGEEGEGPRQETVR